MVNGKCSKRFPRAFQSLTTMDDDGYPLYCRPDDGRAYEKHGVLFDNRWIVPYNPYLLAKYQCHMNLECATSFATVKYVNKYIHKGSDRTTLEIQRQDETKMYLDSRYICAPEGVARILHHELHGRSPNVVRLQVCLCCLG